MKRSHLSVLLIGLFVVGCTPLRKETMPEQPRKTTAAKPPGQSVPPAVARLLPPEQITEANARAQAQLLDETLKRESGQARAPVTTRPN